ncbi:hypothetical protein NFI96_029236 [Prochilodus magdalenae]|nr:hypothetical protein NFI96_029236 [Prochilodus magdalenae]
MPYSGLMERSYRGPFLSSTANIMYFIFILFLCQGVNTGSTHSKQTGDANVHKAVLSKGQNQGPVEEITIRKSQKLSLSCTMTDISSKPANITGYWKQDGLKMENSEQTGQRDKQYLLKKEVDVTGLGNYSCVFSSSGSGEEEATFVIKAPVLKERDKPIVSYIGDSVILVCHMDHGPNSWEWYKLNGTEKVLLNITAEPNKYKINSAENDTKLTVLNLTEEDAGKYACKALFSIGPSEGKVELKVLSFSEPVKPFLAIAAEVVILVTLILLYERHSHSRKRDSTENGPQSEQTGKLTQDETNGVDGGTTTRHRKVDQ